MDLPSEDLKTFQRTHLLQHDSVFSNSSKELTALPSVFPGPGDEISHWEWPRAGSNNLPNFSRRQFLFRIIIKSQKVVAPFQFKLAKDWNLSHSVLHFRLTRYKTAKLSKMQQHSSGRYFSIFSRAGLLDTS